MLCPACSRSVAILKGNCPHCGETLESASKLTQGEASSSGFTHSSPQGVLPAATGPLLLPAGFWRRFFAMTIDAYVIYFIRVCLGVIGAGSLVTLFGLGSIGGEGNALASMAMAFYAVILILGFLLVGVVYSSCFECSKFRATPGKIIMQAYVADLEGSPVTFWRALARNFSKLASAIIFGLGYLFVPFNRNRQALHDMLAGTLILRKPEATAGRYFAGAILAIVLYIVVPTGDDSPSSHGKLQLGNLSDWRSRNKVESYSYSSTSTSEVSSSSISPASSTSSVAPVDGKVVSDNFAKANGVRLDLHSSVAFMRDGGEEIQIGLFRNTLSESVARSIEQSKTFLGGTVAPDLILTFKFRSSRGECSAEELSNYVVEFRASPTGFKIPGNHPYLEFARAVTSAWSREGIGLACSRVEGGDFVVALKGNGGGSPGTAAEDRPYVWDVAVKSRLVNAD